MDRIAAVVTFALGPLGLLGCTATVSTEPGAQQQSSALVVTNCTGSAISAAVFAGGSVILNCGPSPITVNVPSTTVARSTSLSSAGGGAVTLAHTNGLFTVTSGATFTVAGINFDGSQTTSFGPAFTSTAPNPGNVVVQDSSFHNYTKGFVIFVGGGPSSNLTLQRSTFDSNRNNLATLIYNEGATINVTSCTFSNNSANDSGTAIKNVAGTLNVSGSTFFNNTALASNSTGGAIANSASSGGVTITNSTFYANMANLSGGAVASGNSPTTIGYSTFVNNHSVHGTLFGNITVNASVIYDPTSSGAACSLAGASNIQWPPVTTLCGPGFRYADPKLGAFGNNGGFTATFPLSPGSAAIDSSTLPCPPPTIDQRGVARPRDGNGDGRAICDIGSFEL